MNIVNGYLRDVIQLKRIRHLVKKLKLFDLKRRHIRAESYMAPIKE